MENLVESVTAKALVESAIPNLVPKITGSVVAPIVANDTIVPDLVKKGWWANSSTMTKGLVITGVLAVVGVAVWYFGFRKKDEEEDVYTEAQKQIENEKSEEELAHDKIESVVNKLDTNRNIDPATLPNGGNGCSEPRTTYSSDDDFVKCEGTWYIKTKVNPSNKKAIGRFKDWTPLEEGQLAIEQLNSRFPND